MLHLFVIFGIIKVIIVSAKVTVIFSVIDSAGAWEENMEFTRYKCPVCGEAFKSGDDIVVCPECGAPHHRSCFESLGRCFYSDKHSDGFSFEESAEAAASAEKAEEIGSENAAKSGESENGEKSRVVICPSCRHANAPGSKFCNRCGYPIGREADGSGAQQQNQGTGFGADAASVFFDPLAGMNPEEEISEGIKVSEMAKFTGKNTQYFLLVFKRIKEYGRSKFNFASFLMPGVYLLYRKMTVLGLIFSLVLIVSNVFATYIYLTPEWSAYYNDIMNAATGGVSDLSMGLSLIAKMMYVYIPVVLTGIRYVLMVLCGLLSNRWYRRHCVKRISRVKEDSDPQKLSENLEKAGGVNLGLAISFGAAIVIVGYVCNFFMIQAGLLF